MRVKIPKYKIKSKLEIYNKPNKVYIPLISGYDTNITVLVNKGEYVYKGSIIGKRKGNFRIPVLSSVSGTVIEFKDRTCFTGEKVKCVEIQNDFKEKMETNAGIKKEINKYSKEEFIEILMEKGIVGLGGSGFPTYIKYESKKTKTLIINAIECEPFLCADEQVSLLKCEEILETIDAILEINNIENAIIALNKNNNEVKKLFDNYAGTYLKIKVVQVPNYYPMGWEKALVKHLLHKDYDKLPSEIGVIVNNIGTIYAIYEALKYNKPLIERIVTFSGEMDKKNVLVKIGTPVNEIMSNVKGDTLIAGGPMMGVKVDDDLVVTPNLTAVLSLNYENHEVTNCINCGKCASVCPANLCPVMIMKNNETYLNANKCIECGLCSYICPAKIKVREFVKKAKEDK